MSGQKGHVPHSDADSTLWAPLWSIYVSKHWLTVAGIGYGEWAMLSPAVALSFPPSSTNQTSGFRGGPDLAVLYSYFSSSAKPLGGEG